MVIMNFNDVEPPKNDLIPEGTVVKVRMFVKSGGYGKDGALSMSKRTEGLFLKAELTVIEGEYTFRKIYDVFGVSSHDTESQWAKMGLQRLRAILESAYNIEPSDNSPFAKSKREITGYMDFNGLEFLIKVRVEKSENNRYPPQNRVKAVITPDWKEYKEYHEQHQLVPLPNLKRTSESVNVQSEPDADSSIDMDDIPF